jgi:hypothetical protein
MEQIILMLSISILLKMRKKVWEEIKNIIDKYVPSKIYEARRLKGKQKEYQLYISGKKNVIEFLEKILPFTKRWKEVAMYLKFLKERGRDVERDMKMLEETI